MSSLTTRMLSLSVVPSSSRSQGGQRSLLISVDFGTTYSGIGWVETGDILDHHIITEWPGKTTSEEKAPTTLQYSTDGTNTRKWGFEISDEDSEPRRYEWFKLGLYPDLEYSALAQKYPSKTAQPQVRGRDCERLIAHYLMILRQHVTNFIEEKYQGALVSSMSKEYIITVPAIWPEKAQNTTLLCAAQAGMGDKSNIRIISEPEAAGIYALKKMAGLSLNVGDTFVICDAGGGTVDLISYTITTLLPTPELMAASSGSGGLCGSVFLDRIFDRWLSTKFANFPKWDEEYHAEAMRKWNDLKKNFKGDRSENHLLRVRGLPDDYFLGIKNERLTITGEDIRAVFEPVIVEILRLVRDQVNRVKRRGRSVKKVLLVGGFGSNIYLKQRIEEEVGPGIGVIKIENNNSAIVRGALIRAIAERHPQIPSVRVASRIANKSYGILSYTKFDPSEHDFSRKEPGEFEGYERVKCYQWFIKKQDRVLEKQPKKFGYYLRQVWSLDPPKVIEIDIYICENDKPPLYENTGPVSKLFKLKADLSGIPPRSFTTDWGGDGLKYYRLDFDIEVALRSADMSFHLIYNDIRYATVSKEFV